MEQLLTPRKRSRGSNRARRRALGAGLTAALALLLALVAGAAMRDDDLPGPTPQACQANVLDLDGAPYLNGLPVILQSLEIAGEYVKVVVLTSDCIRVTPASLPFEWQVTGPSGPVALEDGGTLRPHFRPLVAGAYEARLTYCPQSCALWPVGSDVLHIPPQTASLPFSVVPEMPVPPATQPVLTPTALRASPLESHEEADRKCGFPGIFPDAHTPQLVPVRPWDGAEEYALLEGRVSDAHIASSDNWLNHDSHDVGVVVEPDPERRLLLAPGHDEMEIEWESNSWRGPLRPVAGDRISAYGFHTYDCHHQPFSTEIHPAVLTAVHRNRAVRVPDGSLGSNMWVPGVITDIWANVNAGEMSSNCSWTGLHQEAILVDPPAPPTPWPPPTPGPPEPSPSPVLVFGKCIQSPHPLQRSFTFNVYLPEDPQKRAATAGLSAPPAPLHVGVESGVGPRPVVVLQRDPPTADGVPYLQVTVDLTGFTGDKYSRRISAAWILPSPSNWGLERWKLGIPSMDVFDDLDVGGDGEWVVWAATNNRGQEWTRLLNGDSVGEGSYTFGGRPWETGSPDADRSLGPHLLLFNPPFSQFFPGQPLLDLTQSLQIHTSGYDEEAWDDDAGKVNAIERPLTSLPVGERATRTQRSSIGAYDLNYFYERVGPVPAARLTPAGGSLAAAYTVGSGARCTPILTSSL